MFVCHAVWCSSIIGSTKLWLQGVLCRLQGGRGHMKIPRWTCRGNSDMHLKEGQARHCYRTRGSKRQSYEIDKSVTVRYFKIITSKWSFFIPDSSTTEFRVCAPTLFLDIFFPQEFTASSQSQNLCWIISHFYNLLWFPDKIQGLWWVGAGGWGVGGRKSFLISESFWVVLDRQIYDQTVFRFIDSFVHSCIFQPACIKHMLGTWSYATQQNISS